MTLGTFRGDLHVLENGSGVYRFSSGEDWTKWTRMAALPGVTQVYSMAVYEGQYGGRDLAGGAGFSLGGQWRVD